MRGRPFELSWLEEDTRDKWTTLYLRKRDGSVRARLHALWLLRSGWRLGPVAQAVGVHYRSVRRRVGWYRKSEVEAVRVHRIRRQRSAPIPVLAGPRASGQ